MISIKGSKDYLVALESVAMTDVVMTLFMFFFISFSLLYSLSPERLSKIEVRLPRASGEVTTTGSEKAVLTVGRRGEYYVDDVPTSRAQLAGTLGARLGRSPAAGILLKIDGRARFDAVSFALDAVHGLGVEKISVASQGA